MDFDDWFKLAAICFLGAISPGPSFALVASNALVRGRSYGVATGVGHGVGIGLWAFMTAAGIAKIMVDNSSTLLVSQTLGACLIGYIGFRTLMVGDWTLVQQKNLDNINVQPLFRGVSEGFLISLFNPKIALFFLAIFSHIVSSESGRSEIVVMGVTAAVIDALWYVGVALMLTGSEIIGIFENRAKFISMISGSFLILIAVYLLAEVVQRVI